MLIEKSNGNIEGVLELKSQLSLEKISRVFDFWTELTLTEEQREKRMRLKADKAAEEASRKLLKLEEGSKSNPALNKFLKIYKQQKFVVERDD